MMLITVIGYLISGEIRSRLWILTGKHVERSNSGHFQYTIQHLPEGSKGSHINLSQDNESTWPSLKLCTDKDSSCIPASSETGHGKVYSCWLYFLPGIYLLSLSIWLCINRVTNSSLTDIYHASWLWQSLKSKQLFVKVLSSSLAVQPWLGLGLLLVKV